MNIRQDILTDLLTIDPPLMNYDVYEQVRDYATIEQLWAICKRLTWGTKFRVVNLWKDDHIAITSEGMYIAILPDGSTHS